MFHSLTGCDTVSSFAGRGKKLSWGVWNVFPALTDALLSVTPQSITFPMDVFDVIQRFVVLLYSRTCDPNNVNEARKQLFSQGSRTLENILPTEAALFQHSKRAVYQGGYVWGQALILSPDLPNPVDWGWVDKQHNYVPFWTTLPEVSHVCSQLIKCGCKQTCTGRCKCKRNDLNCTDLCTCQGGCAL